MSSFIQRTNHTDYNNDDDDDVDHDPVSYTSYLTTNRKRSRRSSNNTTPSSTHHTHISHNTHESYTPLSPTLTTDSDPPPPPPSSSSTTSGTALDQYLSTSVTNLTAELHRIRSLRRMDSIRYENTISRLKRHVHHLEQDAEEARLASETIQTQSEQGLERMNEGRKRALARVQELEYQLRESEDHHPADTDWQGVREDNEILRRKNTLLERKVTAMEEETELFKGMLQTAEQQRLETSEMEGSRLPSTPSLTSPLATRIGSSSSTSPYHTTTTNNNDEPILSPAQPAILKELNKTRLQLADSERNVRILTRLRTETEPKLKNLTRYRETSRRAEETIARLEEELAKTRREREASKIVEGRWEEFRKELLNVEESYETMERNKDDNEEPKGGWVPQDHKSDIGTQPDENVPPEISTIVRRLRTLSSNLTTTRAECDRLTTRLSTANCRIESLEDEAKRKEVVIQNEKHTRETTEKELEEVRTECRTIKARERVWKREATGMRGLLDTYKEREGGESGVGDVVTGKGGVAGGKRRRSEVTDTSEGNHNSNDNDPIVSGLRLSLTSARDEIRILEERFTDANARTTKVEEDKQTIETELERVKTKFGQIREALMTERDKAEAAEQRATEAETLAGKGAFDEGSTRVLHLRENPMADAIREKYETEIRALKETLCVKDRLLSERSGTEASNGSSSGGGDGGTTTPTPSRSSVLSPSAIAAPDAQKLHQRLKESFREKIGLFREGVYLITGYKIDMIADTDRPQFKVRSMFAEREEDHLMFRWPTEYKGGKGASGLDLMDTDLAQILAKEDSFRYMTEFNSLPAFMASVCLTLFETQTLPG